MRRRDRYANTVWLKRFLDQGEQSQLATVGVDKDHSGALLECLTKRMGWSVEIETDPPNLIVRLYPKPHCSPEEQFCPALSYEGTSLRNILSSALSEVSSLQRGSRPYEVAVREVSRWVP